MLNFEEKLNLKHASSINLLNELKKAKSEKQARKIAYDHWKSIKKNFKIDMQAIKNHQFNYKFTKENLKVDLRYNKPCVILVDYNRYVYIRVCM